MFFLYLQLADNYFEMHNTCISIIAVIRGNVMSFPVKLHVVKFVSVV